MTLKMLAFGCFMTFAFALSVPADIPPEPGFARVRTKIVLEIKEPLPDYRFFLVSSDTAREVFVKAGEATTINSPGGGPGSRFATVVAVPAKNLVQFGDAPTGEQSAALEKAVTSGVVGAIKLFDHSFLREVRESEARNFRDDIYRIERTADGLAAVQLTTDRNKPGGSGEVSFGVYDVSRGFTLLGWAAIAVGVLGCLSFGVFMLRRSGGSGSNLK